MKNGTLKKIYGNIYINSDWPKIVTSSTGRRVVIDTPDLIEAKRDLRYVTPTIKEKNNNVEKRKR